MELFQVTASPRMPEILTLLKKELSGRISCIQITRLMWNFFLMKTSSAGVSCERAYLWRNHPLILFVTLSHFYMWKDYLIGLRGYNVEIFPARKRI